MPPDPASPLQPQCDSALIAAYEQLRDHEGLVGSHVSIDRDSSGGETVNVAPDWLEAAALAHILSVSRELELEVVLTKDGLRLAPYSDELSSRVQDVKRTLAEEE